MSDNETILVHTTNSTSTRSMSTRVSEIKVGTLAENVNLFLSQIQIILEKSPENIGEFKFTEFTVSAEISANGKLVLFGSGVEASTSGTLSFKFEKK